MHYARIYAPRFIFTIYLLPWWKYERCTLVHFKHKKSDIQKPPCYYDYLKLALCHYVIMTIDCILFFGNRNKCKFLHPFFSGTICEQWIYIWTWFYLTYTHFNMSYQSYQCKCLKWLHLRRAIRNSSQKRAY